MCALSIYTFFYVYSFLRVFLHVYFLLIILLSIYSFCIYSPHVYPYKEQTEELIQKERTRSNINDRSTHKKSTYREVYTEKYTWKSLYKRKRILYLLSFI